MLVNQSKQGSNQGQKRLRSKENSFKLLEGMWDVKSSMCHTQPELGKLGSPYLFKPAFKAKLNYLFIISIFLFISFHFDKSLRFFRCDSITRNGIYTHHSLTHIRTYAHTHRVESIFKVRVLGLSDKLKMSGKVLLQLYHHSHYGHHS